MLLHYRHRRGVYSVNRESTVQRFVRKAGLALIALLLILSSGTFILRLLGVRNTVARDAATLDPEGRGIVQITFEEGDTRRAQSRVKVYEGEVIETLSDTNANLTFFDGSFVRMDEQSEFTITDSAKGEEASRLHLRISKGSLWFAVPSSRSFTGSIIRTLETPDFRLDIPPETIAYVEGNLLAVFSSDGPGITVTIADEPVVIGEGQELRLPAEGEIGSDLYNYRTPLTAKTLQSIFIASSRTLWASTTKTTIGSEDALPSIDQLILVQRPTDGTFITTPSVKVEGKVSGEVATVRINAHDAALDRESLTFSQELSVPESEDFMISVKALATDGTVLSEKQLTVHRDVALAASPTITDPAKAGETYRTKEEEIVIRGQAPAGAAAILVNDYQLKLFDPEKGTWSYVASVRLGNMKPGANTYDIVGLDAEGKRSEPARLTIIQGEETPAGSTASSAGVDPTTLPSNAPLTPGILSVTAPTSGTSHVETGTGFLLEGKTSAQTDSVWVNDYRLQLYQSGKTFWNYIASAQLGTLKRGQNTYKIVARNVKGEILDQMEYSVEFKP